MLQLNSSFQLRFIRITPAFALFLVLATFDLTPAAAANATWTNDASSTWATGTNWDTGSAPGATSGTTSPDTATFYSTTLTASRVVTVDSGRNVQNLLFTNSTTGFTLQLTGGSLLLSSGGKIEVASSAAANIQTFINSPITLEGSYTFLNNSGNAAPTVNALEFQGSAAISGAASLGAVTLTLGGTNGNLSGKALISGVIANGSGNTLSIVKQDSGNWQFNGANSFSGGLLIKQGGILIGNSSGLGGSGSGAVTLGDNATGQDAQLDLGSSVTAANPLSVAAGAGNRRLTYNGGSGNSTYSGTITLNHDLLIQSITGNSARTFTVSGGIGGTGSLIFSNAAVASANTVTLSGSITNSGAITNVSVLGDVVVSGAISTNVSAVVQNSTTSFMTLSGAANTYTANTVINAGTLKLGASASIATSTNLIVAAGATFDVSAVSGGFTLANGQTLQGEGAVNGNVATASGSHVSPAGTGTAGALSFYNDLNTSGGGSLDLDVSTSYSSGNDVVYVSGTLTTGGSISLHALSGAANLDTSADYVLASASFISGSFPSTPSWSGTPPANAANFSIVTTSSQVLLHYNPSIGPAVAASAYPTNITRGQTITITATVTPGDAAISNVTVDLSPIGGSSAAGLMPSNGNVWTNSFLLGTTNTASGNINLTVTATDTNSAQGSGVLSFSVSSLPLVMDMVFYNPGESPRQYTEYSDPAFVRQAGFNGKVFYLFDSATLAVNWDDVNTNIFPVGSASRTWVETNATRIHDLYSTAKAQGLDVYCMSDLVLLPTSLVNIYGMNSTLGNVNDSQTQYFLRILMDKIFTQFPELDGIVVRIGETYLQDAPYHSGAINSPTSTNTIIPLMNLLRDEVCVKLNKKVVFRTWNSFDTDTNTFLAVSAVVEPHTNLIWSIKHCEGDFHRGNPFSKVMGLGRHKFVVEVQCAREYEGKGAYPNYIANGVIEGFEEHLTTMPTNAIRSIRDLYNNSPLFDGIWTWSHGGGWEGPYVKNELWKDLNAWVMAQWSLDPAQSEESVFDRYATNRLQLPPSQAADFRQLALLSAQAVWRGDRSTGNYLDPWWTRDQYFRFPPLPSDPTQKQTVLDDQDTAVTMWNQMVSLADGLTPPDPAAAETLRSSTRYGLTLYRMFRAVINLQALTTAGDPVQIKSWLDEYDACWTNYAALGQQYSNTIATYYVEPSQRTTVGTDPTVALPLFRAAAGIVPDSNGTKGIIETFDSGFPGNSGQNGWSDTWVYGGITTPVISSASPVDGGGNYLTFTQTSTSDSYLRRSYIGQLTVTNDETIRCLIRVDSMTGFTSTTDYLTLTDGPSTAGGSSSGSSFIIRAYGASPGGTMPGLKWALYNGGKNAGSYNAANWVDSGMAIAAGKTYAFTIVLHPVSLTYDAIISDGTTSVTNNGLGFRDNSFSLPNTLIFNARIGNAANILTASVDTITVSPKPVPAPELSVSTFSGGQFQFSFPGEPGESYLLEKTTNLTPPVVWQTVKTIVGTNGPMQATDNMQSDQSVFYRVQIP